MGKVCGLKMTDLWEALLSVDEASAELMRILAVPSEWMREPGYVDPLERWADDGGREP